MTVSDPLHLYWHAENVSKVMHRHRIHTREDLARRLPDIGRATIYDSFTAEWSGRVRSIPVLVAICREFRISLHRIVIDPVKAGRS